MSNAIDIYHSMHTRALQSSRYVCIQHDATNLKDFEDEQANLTKNALNLTFCDKREVLVKRRAMTHF
jgi:hypothetical protein